jgi:mRNA interferase MazF
MTPQPFEVAVVPFPYIDRLAEKRRPALVVSRDALGAQRGRVWVAMITSAVPTAGFADVVLQDLSVTGLSVPSLVRASKLATIETSRIVRIAGRLSAEDEAAVRLALRGCAAF